MATPSSLNGKGVVASRPAAGIAGTTYYATDVGNGQLQRDNGSTYDNLLPQELGYVESTTSQGSITSAVDLTSLTLTVTVGTRPIIIECFIPLLDLTSGTGRMDLLIVDVTASATIQTAFSTTALAGNGSSAIAKVRVNPAAGSRTYKMQAVAESGTGRAFAGSGNPKWLRIYEV